MSRQFTDHNYYKKRLFAYHVTPQSVHAAFGIYWCLHNTTIQHHTSYYKSTEFASSLLSTISITR